MLLREHLESLGDRIFRWRGVLPLLALAELPIAIARGEADRWSPRTEIVFVLVCLVIGLSGLLARALVVGFVPRGTSGRNIRHQKARELNTSGAYSILRNPLYLGNFLCWIGISSLVHDPLLIALNPLLFLAYYFFIILREETFLEEKFGDVYRAYAARVPCLVPKPSLWVPPTRPFSLRLVLRREHDGFQAFVVAFTALQAAWHLSIPNTGPLETAWPVLLAFSTLTWLALKSAKKFTGLLRVPGEPST